MVSRKICVDLILLRLSSRPDDCQAFTHVSVGKGPLGPSSACFLFFFLGAGREVSGSCLFITCCIFLV